MQVSTTDEEIVYAECNAEDYAASTWQSLAGGNLLAPLDHKFSPEQMDEIAEPFFEAAKALAEPWQQEDGVHNPFQASALCEVDLHESPCGNIPSSEAVTYTEIQIAPLYVAPHSMPWRCWPACLAAA